MSVNELFPGQDESIDRTDAIAPVALSIRQPWATLVVLGLKRLEIRRWSTRRSGRVLIHAGKHMDQRKEAWLPLPLEFMPLAKLRGGFIGSVNMVACRQYRSRSGFARDSRMHLNPAGWFHPPRMFGFEFVDASPIPFVPGKGKLFFFAVRQRLPIQLA